MYVSLSPKGDKIAYVNNTLIYKSLKHKKITKDGINHILNGLSDWVYEENLVW